MKRFMTLLLLLCLGLTPVLAQPAGEPQPITVDEINRFNQGLLQRALEEKAAVVQSAEGFMAEGTGYTLYLTSDDLSADSVISDALLSINSLHVEGMVDTRGIGVTSSLADVYAAWPNDNPMLAGTMSGAVLYMRGALPEEVSLGRIVRDGQQVQVVEHVVYQQVDNGFLRRGIQYLIDNSEVIAIRSFGGSQPIDAETAQQELQAASDLQEQTGYFAYDTKDPTQLQREDLVVQGLDFLDMKPEDAVQVFGEAVHEEKVEDSTGEQIRTLQWDGVEIVFIYDAAGAFLRTERITVTGTGIEGPRGFRVGTRLQDAIARIAHKDAIPSASAALYGDAAQQQPPYGRLDREGQQAQLYYALKQGESTLLFSSLFIEDKLVEMSLTR
jgi:hypothetical protein